MSQCESKIIWGGKKLFYGLLAIQEFYLERLVCRVEVIKQISITMLWLNVDF